MEVVLLVVKEFVCLKEVVYYKIVVNDVIENFEIEVM